MKKLLFVLAFLFIAVQVKAQTYGALTLRHVYEITSDATIIDNAGGSVDIPMEFSIPESQGEHGNSWGSFALWVKVDSVKADVSQFDSLLIWYKEMQCDGNQTSTTSYTVSYYDSTQVTSNFDWDSGKWKRFDITPGVCCGLEFHIDHTTNADDSIQVTIKLDYQ